MRSFLYTLLALSLTLGISSFCFGGDDLGESWPTEKTRPPVTFDHDSHNEMADLEESCALCHHLFDETGNLLEDESSEDESCASCHSQTPKEEDDSKLPLRAAFHRRCKNCHLQKQKGPIACGQCHTAPQQP
ncbi:MAG: cytochrome c family protein [Desulfobacterales bacterium]|nr:cytochrome c family protein [Desulfobacterales bacterium]